MYKILLLCIVCTITLTACEKEKQSSAAIGKAPKQILDKAQDDINKATALADEKMKAAEDVTYPESAAK